MKGRITAVATQGRYGSSDWLTSYLLMFSDTGHNWKQYRQEDSLGSFPGNSNADSVVQHKLQQPAVARFLRLIPLDWNPSGRIGLRVETYGCPYKKCCVYIFGQCIYTFTLLPSPGLEQKSKEVVSLEFKTMKNSGMLLHAEGQHGFSLSLELDRGKLLLLLRQASGPPSEPRRLASLGSLLDDQHWHHVALEQQHSHLNLSVDKHMEKIQIPVLSNWTDLVLSVGASQRPDFFKENFHGCLENLLYHDLNLIELSKHRDPQTSLQCLAQGQNDFQNKVLKLHLTDRQMFDPDRDIHPQRTSKRFWECCSV
uniref:Contactin associated protein like 3 n=1 Tax=Oryzias latipes TaxID=8090 RepID=A0A3P9HTA0_ORYLA